MSSRHAGPTRRSRRPQPMGRITVAAVVGLNVLVFGVLTLAGVPLFASAGGDHARHAVRPAAVPVASAGALPATQVVDAVLAGPVPGAETAGSRLGVERHPV